MESVAITKENIITNVTSPKAFTTKALGYSYIKLHLGQDTERYCIKQLL
jgi:hypothetical protein